MTNKITECKLKAHREGNLIAFFDVEVDYNIVLKGLRLYYDADKKNIYLMLPGRKGINDKYYNNFDLSRQMNNIILNSAIKAYYKDPERLRDIDNYLADYIDEINNN